MVRRSARGLFIAGVAVLAVAGGCGEEPRGRPAAGDVQAAFLGAGPQLQHPTRLAVAADGAVYVSDVRAGCVFGYRSGRRSLSLCGLESPLGLAVSGSVLYVGLGGPGSVEAFDLAARTHARTVVAPGGVAMPNALATAPDGTLWVADSRRHVVRSYAPDGRAGTVLGGSGGPGALRFPSGVAADGERVVVADQGNHRVQVYGADGAWIRSIGEALPADARSLDEVRGRFTRLQGVALQEGVIHALDAAHGWVQSLGLDGSPLGFRGRKGACPDCVGLATDVATGPDGRLLVADPDHSRWVVLAREVTP